MKKQTLIHFAWLVLLALLAMSCRLLSPDPPPEGALEERVAQTVAVLEAGQAEEIQPGETQEPLAPPIDEAMAESGGMGACQLVFVSDSEGVWDILALDFNTRQLWQLTEHSLLETQLGFQDQATAINISVSPDGERIAFNSDEKITHAVFVMNPDGSDLSAVGFNVPSNDTWPTWSADGDYLAFQSDRDGDRGVYVMDLEGEIQGQLTNDGERFLYPAWSPVGEQIAMVSQEGYDIFILDVSSGQRTQLTDDDLEYGPPSWSPEGERLVFSANLGMNWELFILEVNTGEQNQLTDFGGMNRFPAWSPDGDWIAFSSDRDGQMGIYLMPAVGGEALRLTDHERQDLAKAWLPGCADTLAGLIEEWDSDAPLVAGDQTPIIPEMGEGEQLDPPQEDSVDPSQDDPVDPPQEDLDDLPQEDPADSPQDDPVDPPQEDPQPDDLVDPDLEESSPPEVTGISIIDVVLDWVRRAGQRVGLIPFNEEEAGKTVWEEILELLGRPDEDVVMEGFGQEGTPIVTPEATPTFEEEELTEETPEPEDNGEWYGPAEFKTEVDIGVEFFAVNCDGLTGEYSTTLLSSIMGTSCSGSDDACGYQYAPVEPPVTVVMNLPERSDSGPCESEFECDWYSEPFDFSYTFIRRAYDCECNGVTQLASVETWSFEYINARIVIHSHTPGVISYATIMAEEVVHTMTHSHPDVPDVVNISRQGVETDLFSITYNNSLSMKALCDLIQE